MIRPRQSMSFATQCFDSICDMAKNKSPDFGFPLEVRVYIYLRFLDFWGNVHFLENKFLGNVKYCYLSPTKSISYRRYNLTSEK